MSWSFGNALDLISKAPAAPTHWQRRLQRREDSGQEYRRKQTSGRKCIQCVLQILSDFEGLVLGCIEADLCKYICIVQQVSSSTRLAHWIPWFERRFAISSSGKTRMISTLRSTTCRARNLRTRFCWLWFVPPSGFSLCFS